MLTVIKPLLVLGLIIFIALACIIFIRKKTPLAFLETHHEIGGYFLGTLSIIYGVLMAFVVFVVWEQFETAENNVVMEVNNIRDFEHLGGGFSSGTCKQIHDLTLQYLTLVINEEWPAMAEGRDSPNVHQQLSRMWKFCMQLEPQTPREQIIYQSLLDQLDKIGDQRRLRLHSANDSIPTVMWVLLIVGGIINVAFTFFFGVRSIRSQCIMTMTLITLIAFILYLIYAINRPFTGIVTINSKSFEEVRERIQKNPAQDFGIEIKTVGKSDPVSPAPK